MTEEKKEKPKKQEEAKQEAPKAKGSKEEAKKETPKKEEKPKESKEKAAPKKKKEEPKKEAEEAKPKKKSTASVEGATPGQVVKVFKKVGLYGECYQVLVRVLEGRDKGNLLRRNVRGPVKENDTLMLKETERDVRAV